MEFKSGYVTVEGDDLYYKVRGEGVPILFIAPGGGDGDNYLPIADVLANSYKVITYDRRANCRSTRHYPEDFSIAQQTRDAMAVLNVVGEDTAYIVGNSSGAVIALDLIATYPNSIRAAVIHEAPIPSVIESAEKWKRFFASCKSLGSHFGSSLGATKFIFGIQMPVLELAKASSVGKKYADKEKSSGDVNRMSSKESSQVLIVNELVPVTSYTPDFDTLQKNKSKIFIACGDYGLKRNTWYAEVSRELSRRIGCELVTFPGHHGSFMDMPNEWANTLVSVLKRVD